MHSCVVVVEGLASVGLLLCFTSANSLHCLASCMRVRRLYFHSPFSVSNQRIFPGNLLKMQFVAGGEGGRKREGSALSLPDLMRVIVVGILRQASLLKSLGYGNDGLYR